MPPPPADRFAGCLLGLMAGDCLGLPLERLSPRRAGRLFPGGLRHRFLFGRGMMSDDTEHACITGNALLASAGDPAAFASALAWGLRWWLLGLPAGIGLATLRSILKLWLGFSPASSGVLSAGNGAAMRSPLLGLVFWDDPDRLRDFCRRCTRLTHTDPRAERGALAAAEAARYACGADPASFSRAEALARVAAAFPPEDEEARRWLGRLREALDGNWDGERFAAAMGFQHGVSGYIYATLPAALWAWLSDPFDFRGGMERILRLGGDADTTGAVYGAVCGAAVGDQGIPQEWLDGIRDFPRSAAWVRELAGRLHQSFAGKREARPLPLLWPLLPARNLLFMAAVLVHGLRRLLPPTDGRRPRAAGR